MTTDQLPDNLRPLMARFDPSCPELLEVGPGWFPLLARLDARLVAIAPGYRVQQVKSKFGALCFYARPSDDVYALDPAFDEAIRAAEWESTETCEDCGAPGAGCYTIRLWSWTLCPEHARERAAVAQS